MFSERCNFCKSCLIRSSQVILGLPLLLLPSTSRVSTTLTGSIVCLLFTCPNHLNLHFCHFNPKLKHFESKSLWFQFCCHFHPKAKPNQNFQLTSSFF
ncbi:hypothetical protein Hanom_Chr09g00811301 [Helianthus anomalus]